MEGEVRISTNPDSIAPRPLWKVVFDTGICLVTLPVWGPAICLIAAIIRISSGRPVFYLGLRSGLYGQPFRIFKFRSMVVDAESLGGVTAMNDVRITKLGGFLRKYKLDELPQLLNVIRGEMSLVGPRPELPQYTNRYDENEKKILNVLPGITDFSSLKFHSLSDVLGKEDAGKVFEEKVLKEKNALRLRYVYERNLLTDLRILFCTLVVIFRKVSLK